MYINKRMKSNHMQHLIIFLNKYLTFLGYNTTNEVNIFRVFS